MLNIKRVVRPQQCTLEQRISFETEPRLAAILKKKRDEACGDRRDYCDFSIARVWTKVVPSVPVRRTEMEFEPVWSGM